MHVISHKLFVCEHTKLEYFYVLPYFEHHERIEGEILKYMHRVKTRYLKKDGT